MTPAVVKVKLLVELKVVLEVVTATGPVAAPGITMATTVEGETEMGVEETPPIETAVVVERSAPFVLVSVTKLPTVPLAGLKVKLATTGVVVGVADAVGLGVGVPKLIAVTESQAVNAQLVHKSNNGVSKDFEEFMKCPFCR
jgi:hypothetical protein